MRRLSTALAAAISPAAAADCTFATAIYKQAETGAVLRFQPSLKLGRFPGTTNVFFADMPGAPKPLFAWVIWNNGESRPAGSLMLDCPEDGQTNEDYAACTIWKGVLYDVSAAGAALLPGESEAPPEKILLPDLGRSVRYSAPFDVDQPPADVFTFDSCGEVKEGK